MKNVLAITLATIFALTGCAQNWTKIKSSGHVVTIERTTDDYDAISVSGFYEVKLVEGREGDLTLEGEDNILENIETVVEDGTLKIRPIDKVNLFPSRGKGVFITIPVDEINAIHLSGTGALTGTKTLDSEDLYVRISGSRKIDLSVHTNHLMISTSGSSKIHLKGQSKELKVRSSGSSNVEAYGLEVDHATFELSGSSNVEITVNESLTSRVSGSGNIKYRGSPEKVNSQISGSGSVSKD